MNPLISQANNSPPVNQSVCVQFESCTGQYCDCLEVRKHEAHHSMSLVSLDMTQASSNISSDACNVNITTA